MRWLFDDFEAGLDFYCRSQRCRDTTILCFGEFNRVRDGCRGDRLARDDVMHIHRSVTAWIFIATRSGNLDDVTRDVLSFLSEDAGHVSCSACAQCNEQKLHW